MSLLAKISPGFKASCFIVGIMNISFFLLMVSQGIMKSMAEFKVPESTLNSPHYADAMFWVFLHMSVIGILVLLMGIPVDDPIKQQRVSFALVVVFSMYTFLDIRTSDNQFGNALYQGPRSIYPVFVDIFYLLLFLRIALFSSGKKMYATR